MRRQRVVLAGLATLIAVVSVVVAVLRWGPSPPPEPLVIAVASSTFAAPLWVAERKGFFAAAGLQATLHRYPSGKLALEAMLRGEAEVATVAETPLVFAGLAGTPFTIIASFASSAEHSLVARADRGIAQVTDLPGHRIGVAPGTSAQYFLHVLLSDQGLSEAAVTVVPLAVGAQAAALAAGQVDAVATFVPYSSQCRLALGAAARSLSVGLRYTGYGNLVVAPDFPRRRPAATRRLLQAMDRTIQWTYGRREEAWAMATAAGGLDPAVLHDPAIWETLNPNLRLDQGLVLLLQAEAQWAITMGLVPPTPIPDYLDFIDTSTLGALYPGSVTILGTP